MNYKLEIVYDELGLALNKLQNVLKILTQPNNQRKKRRGSKPVRDRAVLPPSPV